MKMPKISTLYMITAVLNALNVISAIAAHKDKSVVLLRAITTFNWLIVTALYLKIEQENTPDTAAIEAN